VFCWFVINTYLGYENKVKVNLEYWIVLMNQGLWFCCVVVLIE